MGHPIRRRSAAARIDLVTERPPRHAIDSHSDGISTQAMRIRFDVVLGFRRPSPVPAQTCHDGRALGEESARPTVAVDLAATADDRERVFYSDDSLGSRATDEIALVEPHMDGSGPILPI